MASKSVTCPTCGVLFDPASSSSMPFCSQRCRGIDLRRWLQEEISLPYARDEEDEEQRADEPDDE
jgi:endogenous inhibitor of DNA gyrase (YacG/DUF329 family)